MFHNVSDFTRMQFAWRTGHYHVAGLTPKLTILSTGAFNMPSARVRVVPGVSNEHAVAPLLAVTQTMEATDDAAWAFVSDCAMFTPAALAPHNTADQYTIERISASLYRFAREEHVVVHVYRVDGVVDNIVDVPGTPSVQAALDTLAAAASRKRALDVASAVEPANVVRQRTSLIVVCADEAAFARDFLTFTVNRAFRTTADMFGELHNLVKLLHGDMPTSPNCLLEPAIPRLTSQHGFSLALFDHQRRSVHWMLRCEHEPTSISYRELDTVATMPALRGYFRYDNGGSSFQMHPDAETVGYATQKFEIRGGMLCAPTGSGKTTCVIALVYLSKHLVRSRVANGVRMPTNCPTRRYTNATLIVAPSQVVAQWADEIDKTLAPGSLSVYVVSTARAARAITTDDVHKYDVIILCKDVFTSPVFRSINDGKLAYDDTDTTALRMTAMKDEPQPFLAHSMHWRRVIVDEMHELDSRWTLVEKAVSRLSADSTWGLTATPNFNSTTSFTGNSGNGGYAQLLNIYNRQPLVKNAMARREFVLGATLSAEATDLPPLTIHRVRVALTAHERTMYESIHEDRQRNRLLYCSHHSAADATAPPRAITIAEAAAAMRQRQGTVLAAAETAVVEKTQSAEAARAEVDATLVPIDLVAGYSPPANALTVLSTVVDALVNVRPFVAASIERYCPSSQAAVALVTSVKTMLDDHDTLPAVRTSLIDARNAVQLAVANHLRAQSDAAAAQRAVDEARAACTFFDGVFAELSAPAAAFECPVCLTEIGARVALTSCGHRFCETCIDKAIDECSKCPLCRTTLKRATNVRVILRFAENHALSADVATHGSKLARLRVLMRTLLSDADAPKIIIYVQFEQLQQHIERALADVCAIECVRGSIFQCQASITRFRTDPTVRVMLLASDATISGMTLVEANHVVAVHTPYVSNETEREYSLLWQAVGRIRRLGQARACHLWSLVTDATVEATAYDRQRSLIALRHDDVTFVEALP